MQRGQNKQGFTIVELLIVIVVIGILAALIVSTFSNVQNRAYDTSVQNDLKSLGKMIHAQSAESGEYPFPLTAAMKLRVAREAYNTSRNNLYYCINTSTNAFALSGVSRTGSGFVYTSTGGLMAWSGGLYGADTCSAIGLSAWSGTYGAVGYDVSANNWAAWVN